MRVQWHWGWGHMPLRAKKLRRRKVSNSGLSLPLFLALHGSRELPATIVGGAGLVLGRGTTITIVMLALETSCASDAGSGGSGASRNAGAVPGHGTIITLLTSSVAASASGGGGAASASPDARVVGSTKRSMVTRNSNAMMVSDRLFGIAAPKSTLNHGRLH